MEPLARPFAQLSERLRAQLLALIGLVSLLAYLGGLAARYPLPAGLARAHTIWSSMVGHSLAAFGVHAALYIVLMLLYLAALRLVQPLGSSRRVIMMIVAFWLLSSLSLLAVAPGGESHDVFDYIYRGRMLAVEQISPLAIAPEIVPDRIFYRYISWTSVVDTYGPLWEYTSALTTTAIGTVLDISGVRITNASTCALSPSMCLALMVSVTGYRLLAIGLTGLSGLLIAKLVQYRAPELVPAALLAWFWNPLLLISTAIGAHNDALMLALLLAALLVVQRQRWILALLALALALHVKLTAILFVPPIAIWLIWQLGWRGALWRGLAALSITLPLSWALYWPLGGWQTLPRMLEERSRYLANSVARVGYVALQDLYGWNQADARQATTNAATLLFLLVAALLLARILDLPGLLRRQRTLAKPASDHILWTSLCAVVLAYLLIGSFWLQPWYLTWILAPAALLPTSQLTRVLLPWYSLGALCSSLVGDFLFDQSRSAWTRTNQAGVVVATILLPLMMALLFILWQARRQASATRAQLSTQLS